MNDPQQAAAAFHALHAGQAPLILPNAWDAASARLVQEAGAKAVATSSAALAWSLGYADGHHLPFKSLVTTATLIARAISVPLSVDAEGFYSDELPRVAEHARALISAGVIGINLEDGDGPHDLHLRKIEAVREAAECEGLDLFINARTDVYLKKLAAPEAAVSETIRRARACAAAGASGLFVPGLADPREIEMIAAETALPLNIMAWPGLPPASELARLGVKRVSVGPFLARAVWALAAAETAGLLASGDVGPLLAKCQGAPDFNAWFGAQKG